MRRFGIAALLSVSVVAGFLVPAWSSAPALAEAPVDVPTPAVDTGSEAETEGEEAGEPAPQVPSSDDAVETDAAALPESDATLDAPAKPSGGALRLESADSAAVAAELMLADAITPYAVGDGCAYATPGTGTYANTLCWLDFTGVSTEWVQVSSDTDNISSTQFGTPSVCPTAYRTGISGRNYYRTTKVFNSALGATYGALTFVGCARNSNSTTAQTNSQTQSRAARNAALYTTATTSSDTGTFYGNVTGWPVEIELSSAYVFRAVLDISAPAARPVQAVTARAFPTWSGAFLGNNGFYTGVSGLPALYQQVDAGGTGVTAANRTTTVSLRDIRVMNRSTNARVAGYSIVVADAESTDANEQIAWTHTGGSGFLWLPNNQGTTWSNTGTNTTANTARKQAAVDSACGGTAVSEFPQYSNTTAPAASRTCIGTTTGKTGTAMLQISPANVTDTFTVNQAMQGGGLQAVAFGVVLAGAKVNVEVAGRVLDGSGAPSNANFTAMVSASGYGDFPAETGTTALTGTSGSQFFPISTGSSSNLTFTSNPPAHGTLSSYTSSWVCYKSTGSDSARERWPATGSSSVAPSGTWTQLSGGQFIECTVTYTPPYLTLVKQIDAAGTGAANVAADFVLTAERNSMTPASRLSGPGSSTTVTKQPIAIGTYEMTETAPPLTGGSNWQFGYTWTDLSCTGAGSTGNTDVAKDPVSGAVTAAHLTVERSRDITCTYTNTANQPNLTVGKQAFQADGTTPIAQDAAVAAGQTVTYRLTFDNSQGTALIPVDHIDHLRDVLDDATFVAGSLRYGNSASAAPSSTTPISPGSVTAVAHDTTQPSQPADLTSWDPRIEITSGTVPALSVRTVSFQVVVKANETDAAERQRGDLGPQGYLLRNYVTAADEPVPTICEPPADGIAECTTQPVRAWTVQKDSQPSDGAMIHSGGNIYYRIKITNYSGQNLEGVQVRDDLTQTLAAAVWDRQAPPAVNVPNGVSFYDADNNLLQTLYNWSATGADMPTVDFVDRASCDIADHFPGEPIPAAAAGCWTLTSPSFTMPAQIGGVDVAYGVVGYAVRGGSGAVGGAPTEANTAVPVEPNATWVNTAQAGAATIGGASLFPNRCSAAGDGVPPGWINDDDFLSAYDDCKTYHLLGESYFHIWKKFGPVPAESNNNLTGASFVLSDTLDDALHPSGPQASRWLCRVGNNPYDAGTAPAGVTARPAGQAHVLPGSDPALSGAGDWGEASTTHEAIIAWNKEIANGTRPGPMLEQCGQFFYLDTASQGQAAGSWRAVDVRGGDTVDGTASGSPKPEWRTTSANNNGVDASNGIHGTYWLVETVSPSNYQLLAQPMQMWVAPSSPAPGGLAPGNPEFYDYQGRLSLPVVGTGESALGAAGMAGSDLRQQCVSPYQLPVNGQPTCVMPTGWTMPVFDVKLSALPLTGGIWLGVFTAGGALLLLGALGVGLWWRRRQAGTAVGPRDLEGGAL